VALPKGQIVSFGFLAKLLILLVPVERIELPTFGLQNRYICLARLCTTQQITL
jgi:hypothetical protein